MSARWLAAGVSVLFASTVAAAEAAGGMVKNGGFEAEDPTDGWIVPDRWKPVDGAGPDGSRALVWENGDPSYYAFPIYRVRYEPGGIYRFGAKVRKDRLETGSVYVSLEWCDRNGKWLNHCDAARVRDNSVSLSDGWERHEGVTAPMPSDVGRGSIICFLTKGSTGRVRVDDFFIEKQSVEPIEFFTSSAYRDTAVSGPVRFFASLYLDTQERPLSSYAAELLYRDASGGEKVRPADGFSGNGADFRMNAEDFATGRQTLGFRVRDAKTGAVLAGRELVFTRETAPVPRRVSLDAARRLTVDGRRFFPLGAYVKGMTRADLDIYAQGPFNSAVSYGNVSRSEMDEYRRHGIMVSPDIRGFMSVMHPERSEEELRAKLAAKVKEIGDHPALLTWYVNDEAPVMFTRRLAKVNEWFHELDPDHPTFAVLDKPYHVRSFMPSYDILAIDSYPIGYNGGEDVGIVSERLWAGDEAMLGFRGTWKVPQAFNWAWYRKGEDLKKPNLRVPTREEMANMAWQAIAAGANGLYFYSFKDLMKELPKAEFEKEWAKLCDVGDEIKRFERVLVCDDAPQKVSGWSRDSLAVRVFSTGSRHCLLAVNRTLGPVKTAFTLAAAPAETKVLLGGGLSVRGRDVSVDLPKLGYALVALSDR